MYLQVDTVSKRCYNPLVRVIDTVSTKVLMQRQSTDGTAKITKIKN